jgi:hypothetical protein
MASIVLTAALPGGSKNRYIFRKKRIQRKNSREQLREEEIEEEKERERRREERR